MTTLEIGINWMFEYGLSVKANCIYIYIQLNLLHLNIYFMYIFMYIYSVLCMLV